MELISPGALPNSMTVEKMVAGRRTPRNPIIMEVLRDYQYVDARGMGIRTKVIPIMREFNGTAPVFEATEDYLKTILYNNGPINGLADPINDPKTTILTLMLQNPALTYKELAASIDRSTSTVKRYIQELKASGAISRVGGAKGGRWNVK
jgi:predicted HTH transcriptional regulator